MLTFQDYRLVPDTAEAKAEFIEKLINDHEGSAEVKMARDADEYYAQRNITIAKYAKILYTQSGRPVKDFTAPNNKIASNFFFNMNTRRCAYSLGNGVEFNDEKTKIKLGLKFDTRLQEAANHALIHGCAFMFWNLDHVHEFKLTEFAPLWDEYSGLLRAGVRYWQIEAGRPLIAVLYEEDGYTEFVKKKGEKMKMTAEKRAYKQTVSSAPADKEAIIVDEANYSTLPIIPIWGSELHQSTLVGLRAAIDAFDLIRSGFANDLQECAEVYWILENYNGMKDDDLVEFRDRLKLLHIATADTGDNGRVTPHTHEIPHAARTAFLSEIRAGMYEDFCLLDLRTLSAAATNDHIAAGYQSQDDMADKFEYQIIESVQNLLALIGIEDTPKFKRNRISNQKEQVELLALEDGMVELDDQTLLEKFPNFTPEEVAAVIKRVAQREVDRYNGGGEKTESGNQDAEDVNSNA